MPGATCSLVVSGDESPRLIKNRGEGALFLDFSYLPEHFAIQLTVDSRTLSSGESATFGVRGFRNHGNDHLKVYRPEARSARTMATMVCRAACQAGLKMFTPVALASVSEPTDCSSVRTKSPISTISGLMLRAP